MNWKIALAAGLLCGLAAGCERDPTDGPGPNPLNGTRWRLVRWTGETLNPARFNIRAEFSATEISGQAAVNSYSGPCVATLGGRFTVGALSSTTMAGTPEQMRAEAHYFNLLRQARSYVAIADRLTLRDGQGRDLLEFVGW